MSEKSDIYSLSEEGARGKSLNSSKNLAVKFPSGVDSTITRDQLGGRVYFVETTDRSGQQAFAVQEELGRRGIYEWSFWAFSGNDQTPEYRSIDRFKDKSDADFAWRSLLTALKDLEFKVNKES